MKTLLPIIALGLLALPASAADALTTAVEELGRINGVALACKQPALVSRARNAVITTAPKTRGYGEAFENATNAAFLAQGQAACPDAQTLASELGNAEGRLQKAAGTSR
jgi:hypothetical protein